MVSSRLDEEYVGHAVSSSLHSRNKGPDFQASQAAIKPRIKTIQVMNKILKMLGKHWGLHKEHE